MSKPTPKPEAPSMTYAAEVVTGDNDLETSAGGPPGSSSAVQFLSPPEQPDEIGRLGSYRVLKLLGEGGMGFVYHAEDTMLHRAVALKVMRPEVAAKATAKDRFLREGRAAAKLKNDHVVTIYFVGEANGVPYMALEFLEGKNLDDWLKDHPAPVSLNVLLKVARDVLKGLAAAHEKGLVHRDIKPANLWIEKGTNRVKVLDFGLTRDAAGADQVTQSGTVVGTPAYMAPEQAGGKAIDGRTDLFSVGVVLHRMISGSSPFQRGEIYATLTALALEDPDTLSSIESSVPLPISDWVGKLLAKKPENRHASAKAALAELATIEKALKNPATAPTEIISPSVVLENVPKTADPTNVWAKINAPATASAAVPVESLPAVPKPTPRQKTQPVKQTPKSNKKWIAGGLIGLVLAAVAGFIIIKVTNKDGTVTELKVPDDSKVEVIKNDKTVAKLEPGVTNPTVPPPAVTPSGWQLDFDKDTAVTVPSLKHELGPMTIEVSLTWDPRSGLGTHFAGFLDGLRLRIKQQDEVACRWTNVNNDSTTLRMKSKPLQDGKYQFALVYTSTEILGFLNGKLMGRVDVSGYDPKKVQKAFTIGGSGISGYTGFEGRFHGVRVSKSARYTVDYVPELHFTADKDTLALYHFDEGQGDVLKDSSGNNHHGKIVGAKWMKVEGVPAASHIGGGTALTISGIQRVQLDTLKLDISAPFTLEATVTSRSEKHQTFLQSPFHSALGINSGKGIFATFAQRAAGDPPSSRDTFGVQPVVVGKKIQIAGVYTGNQMLLFIDGKLEKAINIKSTLDGVNQKPFTIGTPDPSTANDFLIEEVRFSKTARYTKDYTPQKRFENDNDTVALYHCDEGEGNTLKDSSGNNHHGKIVGAKWMKADEVAIALFGPVPPVAKASFDAAQAKAHQEAWAKHLGVKVETPNSVGGTMVLIPPSDTVPKPYFLGKFEVTQAEWAKVLNYNPSAFSSSGSLKDKVAGMNTSSFPVEMVNWFDCAEYCNKLSEKEELKPYYELTIKKRNGSAIDDADVKILGGNGYHIPTDAEWEQGSRAGANTKFHYGDNEGDLQHYAWFDKNSDSRTHSVGEKKPNAYGLHDAHGNVREWIEEVVTNTTTGATEGGSRGGNSNSPSRDFPFSYVRKTPPSSRSDNSGLRVARAASAMESPPSAKRTFKTDEWIDVIPLIDPALDKYQAVGTGKNDWRLEKGELRLVSDDKDSWILFPLRYKGRSVEWEIDCTRTAGPRHFMLDIPCPGGYATMQIDTAGGSGGIYINKPRDPAAELHKTFKFINDKRVKLGFRLTRDGDDDRIDLSIDGKASGTWKGDLSNLIKKSTGTKYDTEERRGIYINKETDFTFHSIRVRMLDGATAETIRPMASVK